MIPLSRSKWKRTWEIKSKLRLCRGLGFRVSSLGWVIHALFPPITKAQQPLILNTPNTNVHIKESGGVSIVRGGA